MTDEELDDSSALTLGELIDEAAAQLEVAGVPDAAISARRIGETAAGVEPRDYGASRQTPLTKRMVSHADAMLQRRVAGEPLQYVVGSWAFRQLDLAVDRRALIPRPETETVAGVGIELVNGLDRSAVVVDLGTGTGAIAFAIAQEAPRATVVATDRSSDAIALARANLAGIGPAATRVTLAEGHWFDALDPALRGSVDLVISNPPYVPDDADLPAEVSEWEPGEALFSGPEGMDDLAHLLVHARSWLQPGGWLVMEGSPEQMDALTTLATRRGYTGVAVVDDLAGRPRAIRAQRPDGEPDPVAIDRARDTLLAGGAVVAPTDTVPGVLASYGDEAAVRVVYAAKRRPHDQPLPILVSGVEQAAALVELDDRVRALAQRFWPGALTIVANRIGGPDPVHGQATLGLRAPDLGWLRELIDDVGPVTGSSANLHGEATPASAGEAARQLEVDVWVDGGMGGGVPSTVIDATGDGIVVLREGAIAAVDLEA